MMYGHRYKLHSHHHCLNIDESEEQDFKQLAGKLLPAPDEDLRRLIEHGEFSEVSCDEED
jgi:hypothetical protein